MFVCCDFDANIHSFPEIRFMPRPLRTQLDVPISDDLRSVTHTKVGSECVTRSRYASSATYGKCIYFTTITAKLSKPDIFITSAKGAGKRH